MHLRYRIWKFWYSHFTWRGRMQEKRRQYNAMVKAKGGNFTNDYSGSLIHAGLLEAAQHWAPRRRY